jgi:hydroxymethylpyrimidine kinase / phosphomethylpyrimidine kinase / thiamine-phosphate diphosphorylase
MTYRPFMAHIPVMTIGGSDPSGGAGIQTDIKAFQSLDLHPISVITSITVQNTQMVKQIIPLSPDLVTDQIETIMEDIPVKYVKTGLLYHSDISKRVAQAAKKHHWHLIVDPVLTATSGDALSVSDFEEEIKRTLLPVSEIITPNIPEAERLTKMSVQTMEDMKKASKILNQLGTKTIILKGGHLQGDIAHDVLYDGKEFAVLSLPRIPNRTAHGSGCTFSALLTGFLAKGLSLHQSFTYAKASLWHMIYTGYHIGKGSDVLSVSSDSIQDAPYNLPTTEHMNIWMKLYTTVTTVLSNVPLSFIPEVGCNIGYALANAKDHKEICAIDGRIVRTSTGPHRCGSLQFGASKHIASIILAAMRIHPTIRCAMNIKYRPEILALCKKTGYTLASFDRANEPPGVSSMDWGTINAIEKSESCPDLIYDTGGKGKEPMIRILGTDPDDVTTKLKMIIKTINKRSGTLTGF